MRNIWSERRSFFLVMTSILCFGIFALIRLQYGIDFRDEAYYVALPHTFNSGAEPFVSEYSLHQTSGFLIYPFVKIYSLMFGYDGIIFFIRVLFLVGAIVISLNIGSLLGKNTSLFWKVSAPSLVWMFWPFSIPSLSYNTLCSLLFLFSLFLTSIAVEKLTFYPNRNLFYAGITLVLSTFSYPPMIIPSLLFSGTLFIVLYLSRPKVLNFKFFIFGAGLASVTLFLFLSQFGWKNIISSFEHVRNFGIQGGSLMKILKILESAILETNLDILEGSAFLLCALILVLNKKFHYIIPTFLISFVCIVQAPKGPLFLPTYLAVLAPIFIWILKDDESAKRWGILIWIPSMFAGLTTAFSSSNGFSNAMVGCLAAGVLSIFLSIKVHQRKCPSPTTRSFLNAVIILAPLFTCARYQYYSIYGEGYSLKSLNNRVTTGPFKGLLTSKPKFDFLNTFSTDMSFVLKGKKSILIYDDFPAGYLFTNLTPVGPSIWFYSDKKSKPEIRTSYINYFKKLKRMPDIVVELKSSKWNFYDTPVKVESDSLTNIFQKFGYTLLKEQEHYWIWKKSL